MAETGRIPFSLLAATEAAYAGTQMRMPRSAWPSRTAWPSFRHSRVVDGVGGVGANIDNFVPLFFRYSQGLFSGRGPRDQNNRKFHVCSPWSQYPL